MVRSNILKISLCIILFSGILLSASTNRKITINLSNGIVLKENIKKVQPLGIIISENKFINYRLIFALETSQISVVDSIVNYVEDAEIVKNGESFVINFFDIDFPSVKEKKEMVLKDKFLQLRIMTNRAENFEAVFSFSPIYTKNLHFLINYSTGRYTIDDDTYTVNVYGIGVGTLIQLAFGKIFPSFHFSLKVPSVSDGKFVTAGAINYVKQNASYININYILDELIEPFFFTIGGRYYFENIDFIDIKNHGFNIGLGYKF